MTLKQFIRTKARKGYTFIPFNFYTKTSTEDLNTEWKLPTKEDLKEMEK